MTAPAPHEGPVPPSRSLLVRTTVLLGAAFVAALVGLALVLEPYLESTLEREAETLLRRQEVRARADAGLNAEVAESVLRTGVLHAYESAAAAVADLPIELSAHDADAVRGLVAGRLDELGRDAARNVGAVADEMRIRSEERVDARSVEAAAADRTWARRFGREIAWRAGAVLLAVLAVLFLVHGALLYRSVLAPVARLSEATRAVAGGRLATRLPVQGDDEVARLASSFNAMTESLERALRDLRSLNSTLEERVRQKIAELRDKERELRHAEKMASLGTLAGGVAHEFNNLLGGIQGCAEDGLRDERPEELRETLRVIERTARRGTAITANLLRFARPSGGRPQAVDVGEIVRDVAALVEPEAARNGVEVRVHAERSLVHADPTSLHQVILNLATNALHAMRQGGRLVLDAAREGGDVRVRVSDTGIGIRPEDRERLFEPFFTTRPEGTGLGLSVSYGIVTAAGGRIDVESEPGRGARFTVTLPAEPAEGVAR